MNFVVAATFVYTVV